MNASTAPPRVAVRLFIVLGGVLAALGLVAGHLNRQLLDGPTFADHVDAIRRDDAVATAVGRDITTQVLRARPDLVALRPLVEQVATQVAGGDLLSAPTRRAAAATHEVLTDPHADSVALRLVDTAAVVSAVLSAVAPDRAPVTAEVSVTLAEIGDQAFAETTIAVAHLLGVLAWLLPLAALACFGAAIALSRQRWATATSVGRAAVWAAGGVGVALVVAGWLVRRLDDEELGGAVARAAWAEIVRPLWWSVAVLGAVGAAVALACGADTATALPARLTALGAAARRRPQRPWAVVVRAVVVAAIGIAAVVDPLGVVQPVVVATGIVLVLLAVADVASLAAATRAGSGDGDAAGPPPAVGSRSRRLAVLGAAAVVLVAGIVVAAWPGRDVDTADAGGGDGPGGATVCNGHAELCGRRFNEVAYVASHNSMAAATEPGWFLAEQSDAIPTQLDQGVRALLVDVWSGRSAGTVVRTSPASRAEATAIAEEELGPEVVAAARRVADSVAGVAEGPEARFLCHGLCETGSTPFLDMLGALRVWLAAHPDEVVTLFIEDHVDAAAIAADVATAGLVPYAYQPVAGQPWPTLADMIRADTRLVVMLEEGRGGEDAPWLVNGFELTQDTPYTFPTVESFSCAPNRGPADAPLFLLNHWLSGFGALVSNAQLVNTRDVLLSRAEQCREERGQIPNFVAVNYVAIGDVFAVVDALNHV